MTNTQYEYAFIGAGNMAKGIIAGMIANGVNPKHIITSTHTKNSGKKINEEYGVHNTQNNNDCLSASTIILAVKPQILLDVLATLNTEILAQRLIVSVIAGIPCKVYQEYISQNIRFVRTMPNMPAQIGQGMTGLYSINCTEEDKNQATNLMACTGKTLWLESESGINFVNAISGSGPAYVYAFIDHLAQSGQKLGLTYSDALDLALQTVSGSSALAAQKTDGTPESMQRLIQQITSKGGTTYKAMQSFEKDKLGTVVDNAVQQCYKRAVELSKQQ